MTKFGLPPSISREPPSRFGPQASTPREMSSRVGMPALSKETVWKVGPPANSNREKQACQARKCEKKIPLKGWDVAAAPDDGIETWAKRQAMLESKRGHTKKRPVVLDSEYYISPKNRCSALNDAENFAKESLHHIFSPKEQKHNNGNSVNGKVVLKYKYTNSIQLPDNAHTFGIITPVGFTKSTECDTNDCIDPGKDEITNYRHYKITGNNEIISERRSKSVPENHSKNKTDQRSSNYYKIKQILRLSKCDTARSKGQGFSIDEDEDEGYSSKTSSAEAKEGIGTGLHRKSSSMVDLTELPSEKEKGQQDKSLYNDDTKIKFSYTHQNREPSILRLPDSTFKLGYQNICRSRLGRENIYISENGRENSNIIEFGRENSNIIRLGRDNSQIIEHGRENTDMIGCRREQSDITAYGRANSHIGSHGYDTTLIERSDTPYRRLHRHKEEAARCVTTCIGPDHVESTTVYNINTVKPVTLVLRKISIQNADGNIAPSVSSLVPPLMLSDENETRPNSSAASRICSRAESRAGSRIGMSVSRAGSPVSRAESARSRASSARSCISSASDRLHSAKQSPRPSTRPAPCQSVRNVKVNKPKEAIWSPSMSHVSVLDRQESNCCIGDLIPAMDKSIYTNQFTRSKPYTCTVSTESQMNRTDDSSQEPAKETKMPGDDGYMLLKKGLDLLTGSLSQKPTLGPPPFRPNQSRHPLIQNVTVISDQGLPPQDPYQYYSPVHDGKLRVKTTPRIQSDKGSRHDQMQSDKATQKKLKEAFSKFYQNRPKDIGKEFRRMQTMWNT